MNNEKIQTLSSVDSAFIFILSQLNHLKCRIFNENYKEIISDNKHNPDIDDIYANIQEILRELLDKFPQKNQTKSQFINTVISDSKMLEEEISSFLEIPNNKLVLGGKTGSLSLWNINYNNSKFEKKDLLINAHNDEIPSLCHVKTQLLISCSLDSNLKIWSLKEEQFIMKSRIIKESYLTKVLSLKDNRFVCCGTDSPVEIYNISDNLIIKNKTFNDSVGTNTIIQLHSEDTLVSSNVGSNSLIFWNLNKNDKISKINGICTFSPNGLIELNNRNIAISNYDYPFMISIIDSNTKNIVKNFKEESFIQSGSSICALNTENIVYIYKGNFCIISNSKSNIINKQKNSTWMGTGGIYLLNNGYVAFNIQKDNYCGIEIIELNLNMLLDITKYDNTVNVNVKISSAN